MTRAIFETLARLTARELLRDLNARGRHAGGVYLLNRMRRHKDTLAWRVSWAHFHIQFQR